MKLISTGFDRNYLSKDHFWLGCIFVAALLAIILAPLWGIPDGQDLSQHMQFASTYFDAIRSGDLFPGWGANENLGYGSIGIRFYPPLAYYVLASLRFVLGNWFDAMWLSLLIWMFLGMVGVYFWAREFLPQKYAFASSILYAFIPYHLAQIYQLMLFSEFAAAGIAPFCFLFLTRFCKRERLTDAVYLSLAVSLLILTHIPTTLIVGISLTVYALMILNWKNPWKSIWLLLCSGFFALAATAFHWMKIVTEIGWVQHNNPRFSSGYYDYNAYLFPMYLNAGEIYTQRLLFYFDIMITLTFILLVPLMIFVVRAIRNKNEHRVDLKFILGLVVTGTTAFFFMTSLSKPIWEYAPLLGKVQFPWRWLSVGSLIASVTFPLAIYLFNKEGLFVKRSILYGSLSLVLLIVLFDVSQTLLLRKPLPRKAFSEKLAKWDSQAGCQCWWTNWASGKALEEKRQLVAGNRMTKTRRWDKEYRRFSVGPGTETSVRVATFYYPYWKAKENGESISVKRGDDGEIVIPLKNERSEIELSFEEPGAVSLAHYISFAAWILIPLLWGFMLVKKKFIH